MHETMIDIRILTRPDTRLFRSHRESNKRKRERMAMLGAVAVLIAVLALLFGIVSRSRAEVVLTPHTCLGGWKNPSNASGVPDVTDGDPAKYSDANSASISDTLADLFCGDFSGDIPKDTKPTAITVKFSWALVPKGAPVPVSASPSDIASSTSAVLDAPDQSIGIVATSSATTTPEAQTPATDTPSLLQTPATAPANAPPPAPLPEPVMAPVDNPAPLPPVSAPADAPATPPPPDPAPQSSLSRILAWLLPAQVHAQEAATSSTTSTTDTASEATTTATTTPAVVEDAILEVSYTLDGLTWHVLGAVSGTALPPSFTIPLEGIEKWDDLSKLQIRVRALSGLSNEDVVYLDGMTIQASYAEIIQEVKKDAPRPADLLDKSIFTQDEKPLITVHSHFTNYSTSIILYVSNGDSPETWTYEPETLGFGDFLFSDYFSFASPVGRYQLVEYVNDGQTFSCYGMSPAECTSNPHFISRTNFEIVPEATSSDTIMPTL